MCSAGVRWGLPRLSSPALCSLGAPASGKTQPRPKRLACQMVRWAVRSEGASKDKGCCPPRGSRLGLCLLALGPNSVPSGLGEGRAERPPGENCPAYGLNPTADSIYFLCCRNRVPPAALEGPKLSCGHFSQLLDPSSSKPASPLCHDSDPPSSVFEKSYDYATPTR